MRCRFQKAAALLLVLALCGCGLLGIGGDDESAVDKPAPLVAFKRAARTEVLWQKGIGESGAYVFTPIFADDSIYAANEDGDLLRYNATTGKLIWRVDTRRNLSGGVGAAHNLVLVGDLRGELLAFDNQGYLIWKSRLTSEILSAPRVANGVVVVRTVDGRIFGLDAADGSRKWVYEHTTPTLTVRSFAGVVITHGGVFAGLAGGKLVGLDISSGNVGWEATVALPRGTTELERVTDITSMPAVDDERVCAVAYQGRVGCFDLFRGNLLWARDISSISGLTLDERNLYVSDEKGAVVALDKVSGASVWKQDKLFGRRISAPLAFGNYIVVGDLHGYVHFLSRDDGSFVARRATDGSRISAAPIALDKGLLIQTRDGGLYAMNVEPLP
ncbi:MAG TPA: outer membrane protein assembly factor BamB [Burkholderiales bacterium]|nr:outer membrane protein assembly factor BamB [Burkholderiales bacterium]